MKIEELRLLNTDIMQAIEDSLNKKFATDSQVTVESMIFHPNWSKEHGQFCVTITPKPVEAPKNVQPTG